MNDDDRVRVARTKSRDLQARGTRAERATDRPRASGQYARRNTGLALILSLAALAACAAGVFTVRSVDVVGANLPQDQIAQVARVTGQNIFAVRSDEMIARLDSVPSIEISRVETAFPDRVTVYARLREPLIGWRGPGAISLIDATGRVIGQTPNTSLPVVSGGTQPPPADMVAAIRYAAEALPRTINGAITGFGLDQSRGLIISGKAGWTAIVGRGPAQSLVKRIATLAALLDNLAKSSKQLSTVDLRNGRPFFRLAGT